MSARMKALLGGAGTIAVLAAIILGLWAFTSPKSPTVPTITVSPQQRSQQAFKDGQAALSKDQTSTAAELFQNAVTIDPNNTAAKDALAALKNGGSSSSGSTTTQSPGSSSTATKTPVAAASLAWTQKLDIGKLLPKSFADYILGSIDTVGADSVVTGSPAKKGATVTSIVWAVHDRATAAGASAFISKVSKTLYTHDAATIKVNDVSAYFGTDGKQFATVSFVRGRYVFEVVITSTQAPVNEKTFAGQTAAAFATAP